MRDTERRLKDILVERLGVEDSECAPDADIMNDLGADSLDVVEIVVDVENEFEISVDDNAVDSIHTVQQAIDYINQFLDYQ